MPILEIPSPAGSFTVTIKDSDGGIVYGPTTQTNAPFDPLITDEGDYTVEIDNDGAVSTFCFTISECTCPVINSVTVEQEGVTYYGVFKFQFPDGFTCPFSIEVTTPFTSGSFLISSLADLTDLGGGIYQKTFLIGGFGTLGWAVVANDGELCGEGYISGGGECIAPILQLTGGRYFFNALSGSDFAISFATNSCSGATCSTATINYVQINEGMIGPPDAGTLTGFSLCPNGFKTFPITPNTSYPGYSGLSGPGAVRYSVTVTTCCGNTYTGNT
jgi:hypothetical protein